MRILLVAVNAKYIHSNLAVYSLKAYADRYKEHIGILELTINHPEEEILKEIYRQKADVIAFSCYIWNINIVERVSEELKKLQPQARIWFGGPEVSYDARQRLLKLPQLDGIMIGEGEQTFSELAGYYIDGRGRLFDIAGLAYKESAAINEPITGGEHDDSPIRDNFRTEAPPYTNTDQITFTEDRKPIALDELPFPYEDIGMFRNRIIYYESSRGCPYSCSYCLSSIDRRVRFRSPHLVTGELKRFLEHRVAQVKFIDRTFNASKKHAMEIWRFIKENDNGVTNFHFEIAADLLDEEELEFLATLRPGQIQLEIGVQSTNSDTIEAIHRRMDFDRLTGNVTRLREGRNIHQHLDLIAGLPKEGYESFERSFRDVYNLKPDQLQLGFLKVLKGSAMEEDSETYHIVYRNTAPYEVLMTDWLSYDEMLRIKSICEMVEIYYNSGQFTCSIGFLEHYYPSPMKLYEQLGEFYDRTGISSMAHSRIKRYEILMDFYLQMVLESTLEQEKAEAAEVFEELLIYDLLLRDDSKARPAFAADRLKPVNLRLLYEQHQKQGRQIRIERFAYDPVASAEAGRGVKKETFLLFDYSRRDPLTKAAEVMRLENIQTAGVMIQVDV